MGGSPVAPVDEILKHRHGEHVHVVAGQNHLAVLTGLQVDPLDLVCAGITPVQLPVLQPEAPTLPQGPAPGPPSHSLLTLRLSPPPSVFSHSPTRSPPLTSRLPSSPHSE